MKLAQFFVPTLFLALKHSRLFWATVVVLSLLPAHAQPTVTTLAASSITASNGTLNGTVNPNGAATKAYFQYGLTTNYGSFSTTNNLAATTATLSVTNLIGSLTP